jgi:hypothetical protein
MRLIPCHFRSSAAISFTSSKQKTNNGEGKVVTGNNKAVIDNQPGFNRLI